MYFKRIKDFSDSGRACYLTNAEFAEETGMSESTIKRAIKLLVYNDLIYRRMKNKKEYALTKTIRLLFINNKQNEENQNNDNTVPGDKNETTRKPFVIIKGNAENPKTKERSF